MTFLRYVDVRVDCELGGHGAYWTKEVVYEFANADKTVERYTARVCLQCDTDWKEDLQGLEARLKELSEQKKESVD